MDAVETAELQEAVVPFDVCDRWVIDEDPGVADLQPRCHTAQFMEGISNTSARLIVRLAESMACRA